MTTKTKALLQQEIEELLARNEALSRRIAEAERLHKAKWQRVFSKNDDDIATNDEAIVNMAGKSSYTPAASFESSLFGKLVGLLPNLWSLIPWVLVIAGLVYWYRYQTTTVIDPPTPPDVVTIGKAVGDYFPTQRKEFAKAFSDAAAKVRSKEIKTDEQLDALVNPQLKAARDLASKPFDVSFEMGLPRNDDGSFAGKEEDAAKFLEQISRSW